MSGTMCGGDCGQRVNDVWGVIDADETVTVAPNRTHTHTFSYHNCVKTHMAQLYKKIYV